MNRKLNAAASLSMLGMLLGCAPLISTPRISGISGVSPAPHGEKANPMPVRVTGAVGAAFAMSPGDALFAAGRSAHAGGQLSLAAQRYETLLATQPGHVGALNALAVVYAQRERTSEAFELFARAIELAPGSAHIHNNAGYALLRAGRLDEAELSLKRAQNLDALSLPTQQNLALLAKARAEAKPDTPATQVISGALPGLPVNAAPRLVLVAPQVYALQAPASGAAPETGLLPVAAVMPRSEPSLPVKSNDDVASPAPLVVGFKPRGIRLEVSNGAGIHQLARRTAERLATAGMDTVRLTNARPYRQSVTEIHFLQGQELAAQLLKNHLGLVVRMVPASRLDSGMQLRLVLGRDAVGVTMAALVDATQTPEKN